MAVVGVEDRVNEGSVVDIQNILEEREGVVLGLVDECCGGRTEAAEYGPSGFSDLDLTIYHVGCFGCYSYYCHG